MATIKETVKAVVSRMPGNTIYIPREYELSDGTVFTVEQVKRALRDILYVKRIHGKYIVKGRRVPVHPNQPVVTASYQCKRCKQLWHVDNNGKSRLNDAGLCNRCVARSKPQFRNILVERLVTEREKGIAYDQTA